jgi:hypothetical protein
MSHKPSEGRDEGGRPARSGARAWAFAAVLIALIGAGTYLAHDALQCFRANTPGGIVETFMDRLGDGLKPEITIRNIVANQVTKIRQESKLVVLTADLDATVSRTEEMRVLWGYLNLGTSEATIQVRGNKVQYYVPLAGFTADNMTYDKTRGRVVIRVPQPVLDRDIVEVQSDPGMIFVRKERGWARLPSSPERLEDESRAMLRAEVLKAGDAPSVHDRARVEARKVLARLFGDLTLVLRDGVTLDFEFVEPTAAKAN